MPHPMHFSTFIAGILIELLSEGSEGIMAMAPAGQCLAQFPQFSPSVSGIQFSFTQTACPICMEDFSATVMGRIAPAGQTSEHFTHSGRQYPLS